MNTASISDTTPADDQTVTYYERNAGRYACATLEIDMSEIYERFLRYVSRGGRILDAGCGAGRDTLAFKARGFKVDAFDASPALCAITTELTGVPAKVLRFQDFGSGPRYDGVWACASLLHVPLAGLTDVFSRLMASLKPGAAFYMSFKRGADERIADDGRYFQDIDEPTLWGLLSGFHDIRIAELWISKGEDTQTGSAEWINAIALKAQEGSET